MYVYYTDLYERHLETDRQVVEKALGKLKKKNKTKQSRGPAVNVLERCRIRYDLHGGRPGAFIQKGRGIDRAHTLRRSARWSIVRPRGRFTPKSFLRRPSL